MQAMKVLLLGDGAVGKTTLLITFLKPNSYPHHYLPTVFENSSKSVEFYDETVEVSLWDTAGGEEYDKLRALSYSNTNVFLICYSIINPTSLENINNKWAPEVKHFCPDTPFAIIATKLDLRDDPKIIERLAEHSAHPVTYEEGLAMAKQVGASFYCESSSLTRKGVTSLFNEAIRTGIYSQKNHPKCKIM